MDASLNFFYRRDEDERGAASHRNSRDAAVELWPSAIVTFC